MRSRICFYLPEPAGQLPSAIDAYWDWQVSGRSAFPWWGRYHWVLQTYLRLKAAGYPCELCAEVPDDGIVVTHRDCLSSNLRPTRGRFLVALLVDRQTPHPYAQLHVVHREGQNFGARWPTSYLPPWPQISLLPRDPERADRFETIGFFGYQQNLASPFLVPAFRNQLRGLGLQLVMPPPAEWNDFRNVDGVMAIRSLWQVEVPTKSAIKLINAWHAGVPAVLGGELGFRSVRRGELDYLEATTPGEALAALRRLAASPELRRKMAANGLRRSEEFSVAATTARWIALLDEVVRPMSERWAADPSKRLRFQVQREWSRALHGIRRRAGVYL